MGTALLTARDLAYADTNQLRDAIASLEASTSLIEERIRALQSSRNFPVQICQDSSNPRTQLEPTGQRRRELERQHLQSLNEELSVFLQDRLDTSDNAERVAINDVPEATKRYLQQDDLVLNQLKHQVAGCLELEKPPSESREARDESLLQALHQTLAQCQRLRLDRLYLQHAVRNSPSLPGHSNVESNEVPAAPPKVRAQAAAVLRTDLDSLYADLDDMSCMAANHDFGGEMRDVMQAISHTSSVLQNLQMQTASQRISRVLADVEQTTHAFKLLHSHRLLLHHIGAIATPITDNSTKMAQLSTDARPSDDPPAAATTALKDLLRHLSISQEQAWSAPQPATHSTLVEHARRVRDAGDTVVYQSHHWPPAIVARDESRHGTSHTTTSIEAFEERILQARHALELSRP